LFLPAVLLFYFISRGNNMRNAVLTVFSYIFYAWGEPVWIVLLIFSSVFDYFNGILIYKWREKWLSKLMLVVSVVGNISLLVVFKYGGFLWENINFFVELPFPKPTNTLPIGISFYTFQTISYTVDVYRRIVKPQYNFVAFLTFVGMFTQLVAGPIVRYKNVLRYIENREVTWENIWYGTSRFCVGLFKKVVIANTAGALVEKYLEVQFFDLSIPEAWFGLTMFSVQLYFDFSGYSDMAIGMGRIFGFRFDENFRHPYAATSVADFYRRWHISLGRFFRDYVYIPLGGNRRSQDRNIMIVWLLTGLWHGASWNFVLWGGYFGVFMVIEKYLKPLLDKTPLAIKHVYTLYLIIFSRAIFYFVDFGRLGTFVGTLFTSDKPINAALYTDLTSHVFLFALVIIMCIPWDEFLNKEKPFWIMSSRFYKTIQYPLNVFLLFISTVMLVDDTYNPFIYFRF